MAFGKKNIYWFLQKHVKVHISHNQDSIAGLINILLIIYNLKFANSKWNGYMTE